MRTERVDLLNIGLIFIALVLAYLLPFSSFLIAYAVLGPLHYLTEINWLHDRSYFTVKKYTWLAVAALVVLIITVPKLAAYLGIMSADWSRDLMYFFDSLSNPLLILILWVTVVLGLIPSAWRNAAFAIGVLFFVLAKTFPSYVVIVGAMLPTVVHVYFFTILFMLYGAAKTESVIDLAGSLMVLSVPLLIAVVDMDKSFYNISDWTKDNFVGAKFHMVNLELAQLLGISDGKSFFFYGKWELKMQRFIAFAYVYHYLNWFSKTTIIGWHKGLKGKRIWLVACLWSVLVLLFYLDYRLGFYSALVLSFLHVILEFPLNVASVKGIVVWVHGKLR